MNIRYQKYQKDRTLTPICNFVISSLSTESYSCRTSLPYISESILRVISSPLEKEHLSMFLCPTKSQHHEKSLSMNIYHTDLNLRFKIVKAYFTDKHQNYQRLEETHMSLKSLLLVRFTTTDFLSLHFLEFLAIL